MRLFRTQHHPHRHPGRLAAFALVLLCAVAVAGAVVMFLWNAVLVEALGAKPLNFWRALGLLVLCRILFGHWGPRGARPWGVAARFGPGAGLRERWSSMTPDQRERFRDHWKARCAGRDAASTPTQD